MDIIGFLLKTALFIGGLFLVLLVLVQRGRGGGLAGALGGAGGQSAFGTKAGDVFTKITIVTAAIWILLCAGAVKYYSPKQAPNPFVGVAPEGASAGPATPQAVQSTGTAAPPSTPASTGAPTGGAPAATGGSAPAPTGTGS